MVFEKSLYQRQRNLIFSRKYSIHFNSFCGEACGNPVDKNAFAFHKYYPEVPTHQCLGGGMALDGSGYVTGLVYRCQDIVFLNFSLMIRDLSN